MKMRGVNDARYNVTCRVTDIKKNGRKVGPPGRGTMVYVHTSFPFDPEVMQAGSTRNFT